MDESKSDISSSNKPHLLWDMKDSREMFGDLQLWPSFIGTNPVNERHETGRPPVLVWPEQSRYISSRKRPLPTVTETGSHGFENEAVPQPKKARTTETIPSSIFGNIITFVQGIGKWFTNSKLENAENLETAVTSIKVMIEAAAPVNSEIPIDPPRTFKEQVFDDLQSGDGFRKRSETLKVEWMNGKKLLEAAAKMKKETEQSEVSEVAAQDTAEYSKSEYAEKEQGASGDRTIIIEGKDAASPQQGKSETRKEKQKQKAAKKPPVPSARGYMIGPADVYGGDYSLYKSKDPSQSHSIATVRVVTPTRTSSSTSAKISVKDLIAFARVQQQVGKLAVLAFPTLRMTSGEPVVVHPPDTGDSCSKGGGAEGGKGAGIGYIAFSFKGVGERF